MARSILPAIVLASVLVLGALALPRSASAQPFMVVYASPIACDLTPFGPIENFQPGPGEAPVIPATIVPIGQTLTLDLCFLVWPEAAASTGTIVCNDADSTHSCAEQARFISNGGIQVSSFTPVGPDPEDSFPSYEVRTTPTSLKLAGGHPLFGRQGNGLQGVRWGTVTLTGVGSAGIFELTDLGGWVDAAGQRQEFPTTLIAITVNNCGNSVLDVGEECEDGNVAFGDGCSPDCRVEAAVDLIGSVGPPGTNGSLDVEIDGVPITVDLALLPNAPAEDVIEALVVNVNDEPLLAASAAQVDDPFQAPGNQRRMVTNGDITGGPTITVSQGSLEVPEPGRLAMLASGIALLRLLARRRARSG